MDTLLAQAARYSAGLAIRSGISIAGGFAIRQVSTYISQVPETKHRQELELTSKRLDQKIKIVTPAIDLIEIIAARGNTTLNSTVQLTVALRNDINAFGQRMAEVMSGDQTSHVSKEASRKIIDDMKALMARIEDAVPLISLALTTSGANLSASLPNTVSPSRLLQASSFLQGADVRFEALSSQREVQIGPSFSLKLYTIFEGHSRQSQDPNTTNISWQETYARAILEVIRMPMQADSNHDEHYSRDHNIEYLYHFRVTENLDDGRYHEEIETGSYRRDHQGFIRGASRDIPVHSIARLFFSASGRLLNIEEARTPVLVLKINHGLKGPSALIRAIFTDSLQEANDLTGSTEEEQDDSTLDDLEWVALELWDDEEDASEFDNFDTASEASSNDGEDAPSHPRPLSKDRPSTADTEDVDDLAMQLQVLDMSKSSVVSHKTGKSLTDVATLSLLEYILRLSALQTSEQESILSISDERISLFLRDDNAQSRTKARQEAEAVRRSSNDRFDTPASSIHYDEFIPGTQIKPRKGRRSRQGTPSSDAGTPLHLLHHEARAREAGQSNLQKTPQSMISKASALKNVDGSRMWSHAESQDYVLSTETSETPSHPRPEPRRTMKNLFSTSSDLQSTTNNGFSSRLRHSVDTEGDPQLAETKPWTHANYMAMAIEQARKSTYIASAFCVGCIIVKGKRVISTGYSRELPGNTHAEQCALDKLKDVKDTDGADMYTTMEPCSERLSGNVPCVQRIIAAKIARVYQGVEEPADFVECNGSDLLRKAGVEVHTVTGFAEEAIAIARGQS